jgi:hypothetical protein
MNDGLLQFILGQAGRPRTGQVADQLLGASISAETVIRLRSLGERTDSVYWPPGRPPSTRWRTRRLLAGANGTSSSNLSRHTRPLLR